MKRILDFIKNMCGSRLISLLLIFVVLLGLGKIISQDAIAQTTADAMEIVFENSEYYEERRIYPYKWTQSNIDGFGDINIAQIPALETFNDDLYAGVQKNNPEGDPFAEVWRTADGDVWELVNSQSNTNGCADMAVFNGYLYCGSWDGWLWRTNDGTTWSEQTQFVEGESDGIAHFAVYDGMLYASTWSDNGTKLWRTVDGVEWTQFGLAGFDGTAANSGAISSEIFNGKLYWGLGNWSTGAQLWYTDGESLTQIIDNGFGSIENAAVSALASFDGKLYASLYSDTNIQVWRSDNDVDWEMVFSASEVGNAHQESGMEVYQGFLYLFARNDEGMEVWRAVDGFSWESAAFNGFGDPGNQTTYWDNGNVIFDNRLFVAITNEDNGGEVWVLTLYPVFLPLILK